MQETWGFLDSGSNDAAINMAIDESLLNWHSAGKIPPTLRFYGWNRPSLSVGLFQKVERRIDFTAVDAHQCDFVRRLTGGSAVLHDQELTYSIVISEEHARIPQSVREACHILTKGVFEGYQNLGIKADYALVSERESIKDRSDVCFEKPAYYEMIVDGKKISGNAQTRKKGVLLQHGSIPMYIDENMLFDMFRFPTEALKEKQRNDFKDKAISIDKITNKAHTYDMLKDAFYEGFQTGLDIKLEPLQLSDADWDEINLLADTKYRAESWNKNITQRSV